MKTMCSVSRILKIITPAVILGFFGYGLAVADSHQKSEYDCVVEPAKVLTLSSSVIGVLDQVLVSRGDTVAAGQVVAYLESSVQKASLEIARQKSTNHSRIDSARAQLEFAEQRLLRAKDLGSKGMIATQNFEELEANRAVALNELEAMKHEAERLVLERQLAERVLAQRTIKSPIDGVVQSVDRGEGEYVFQEASIMTVVKLDPLHIETFVPVERYADLKPGMTGNVVIEQPVKATLQAEVIVVDRIFDAASNTTGVRLELANTEGLIPAGQRCRIYF